MPDWKRPDWKRIVRERMSSPNSPCKLDEDVIAELAAHLEETYELAQSRGLHATTALERTLQEVQEVEVNNWHVLAADIHRAKSEEEVMNHRTKGLWLPAMANLAISVVLLSALELLGLRSRIFTVSHLTLGLPLPWLFALPISGAAAALLAKRAQAPLAARLIAGLAPSLVALAAFCVMLLVFLLDRWEFSGFPLPLDYFILSAVIWVVLPAFPLLVGTLPFLRQSDLRKA
jgi:hypothetical protein